VSALPKGKLARRVRRTYGAEEPRERYMPIAVAEADRFFDRLPHNLVERDELLSLAVIGLIEGIDRFDPGRGVPIEAYLRQKIRYAILDGLRRQDRVPKRLRARERLVREAYAHLEQEYQRAVSDAEVAARLGIGEAEFVQWLEDLAFTTVGSLDALSEDGAPEVPTEEQTPDEEALESETQAILARAIKELPEREQQVLWAHYYREYSLHEVALALELSSSYVSQLHSRAILRLRAKLRTARKRLIGGDEP